MHCVHYESLLVFIEMSSLIHLLCILLCLTSLVSSLVKVGIIGGGAAGYFSAIECAEVLSKNCHFPYEVIVLEATRNPLSKVKISGGGRCNVMHDPSKGSDVIAKVSFHAIHSLFNECACPGLSSRK